MWWGRGAEDNKDQNILFSLPSPPLTLKLSSKCCNTKLNNHNTCVEAISCAGHITGTTEASPANGQLDMSELITFSVTTTKNTKHTRVCYRIFTKQEFKNIQVKSTTEGLLGNSNIT